MITDENYLEKKYYNQFYNICHIQIYLLPDIYELYGILSKKEQKNIKINRFTYEIGYFCETIVVELKIRKQ